MADELLLNAVEWGGQLDPNRKVRIAVVMTSDGTSETLLRAVKEQAYDYLSKPFPPRQAVEAAQRALSVDGEPAIEVLSARPHWVELLIPCTRETAERIQTFIMKLEADFPVRSPRMLMFSIADPGPGFSFV